MIQCYSLIEISLDFFYPQQEPDNLGGNITSKWEQECALFRGTLFEKYGIHLQKIWKIHRIVCKHFETRRILESSNL